MQTDNDVKKETVRELAPQYKVILHNDEFHSCQEVVKYLIQIFNFSMPKAVDHMVEAHNTGVSIVMVTHFERAELYCEKMKAFTLTATMEKA